MRNVFMKCLVAASVCGWLGTQYSQADCGACGKSSGGAQHAHSHAHTHAHAKLGHAAPEFTLSDTSGKSHSLVDILKQDDVNVVVVEWFNHQCPYCRKHGQEKTMIKIVNDYRDKGVVMLGVDSTYKHAGKEADINKIIKEWGVNYPILADFDGKVGHQYGAKTTPHMFIINKEGILVYDGAVDNDPNGAKSDGDRMNYVTAALDQVLAGETVAKSKTKPYGCSVKYKR